MADSGSGAVTGVGADIFGVCRRCGEVWHVVVAMTNGRIAKVECKQCGARHAHRTPAGERTASGPRRIVRSAHEGRRATGSRRAAPPVVEANPSRPPRPYRPSDRYETGDRMLHPSFGEGIVQAIHGPSKVVVRFTSGDKTLVQARDAS